MSTLITHIYNEEYLLPFWLQYHTKIFDHGIIIDYCSTDRSLEIIKMYAPTWRIVQSRNKAFSAVDVDLEIMDIEKEIQGWRIVLTCTEFLILPCLMNQIPESGIDVIKIKKVTITERIYTSEPSNLTEFYLGFLRGVIWEPCGVNFFRYMHRLACGKELTYTTGRHTISTSFPITEPSDIFIAYCSFYPFNETLISRKLQIKTKIPASDIAKGYGIQHTSADRKSLIDVNKKLCDNAMNLLLDDNYMRAFLFSMRYFILPFL